MNEVTDIALDTFMQVAREVAPEVPEDLLLRLYKLQKAHQFEDGREYSVQEMQRALEEFISERMTEEGRQ